MANPELELHKATYDRLKADAAVTALVNGRVYDNPSTISGGPVFPYITLGPVDSVEDDADCITGLIVAQQIDAWSRAVGYPEVKKIADAVRAALHDHEVQMPLATNAMAYFEHRNTRIVRDPDGLTSHAILSFEAGVQRN